MMRGPDMCSRHRSLVGARLTIRQLSIWGSEREVEALHLCIHRPVRLVEDIVVGF